MLPCMRATDWCVLQVTVKAGRDLADLLVLGQTANRLLQSWLLVQLIEANPFLVDSLFSHLEIREHIHCLLLLLRWWLT